MIRDIDDALTEKLRAAYMTQYSVRSISFIERLRVQSKLS